VSMTNPPNRIEVVTSVPRRRRWSASEKVRMVEETFAPVYCELVARQHGVAPNQLFTWRRLVAQGSLTAAGSGEEVVPASDYRVLQNQVRELHRLLGKKTLEAEIRGPWVCGILSANSSTILSVSSDADGSRIASSE
jgi:transposase